MVRGIMWIMFLSLYTTISEANEIRIPLAPGSGVQLGQGFDLETMQWRDVCVMGRTMATAGSESTVEVTDALTSVYAMEQTQGSLSAGVSLIGGLASAKAKTSVFSTWLETEQSASSSFRINFGTSYWDLRDPVSKVALSPMSSFVRRCGTYVVTGLQMDNELNLFLKFKSAESKWLEKMRTEIKVKAGGGLAHKKWISESLKQGQDAHAKVKVGMTAQGYFKALLSARLGVQPSLTVECSFPTLEACLRLDTYFGETVLFIQKHLSQMTESRADLLDTELITAATLVPYSEIDPSFDKVPLDPTFYGKIEILNNWKRRLYEKYAQLQDGNVEDQGVLNLEIQSEINQLTDSIIKCEEKNQCL